MATNNSTNSNQVLKTISSPTFNALTLTSLLTASSVVSGGSETLGTASTSTGVLTFKNATNANNTVIQSGVAAASVTYTLPTNAPAVSGYHLASTTGGVMSWVSSVGYTVNNTTGTSATLAANNIYIANNAGLVTYTLPASFAIGDIFEVTGNGAGGWSIVPAGAGQVMNFGDSPTTDTTGSLSSTNRYDSVRLIGTVVNAALSVQASQGNLTVA